VALSFCFFVCLPELFRTVWGLSLTGTATSRIEEKNAHLEAMSMATQLEPNGPPAPQPPAPPKGLSTGKMVGIVIAAMLLTMAGTLLIIKSWLFPSPFEPVVLSKSEEQQLERKLDRLERVGGGQRTAPEHPGRFG
jgi:hypothetical protein